MVSIVGDGRLGEARSGGRVGGTEFVGRLAMGGVPTGVPGAARCAPTRDRLGVSDELSANDH